MKIHAVQTGRVRVKEAQRMRRPGGMLSVLFSNDWSEWLPIYVWVIEHPEGVIVVDTGETARTSDPDYFTAWHPYFKFAARMWVEPHEEIGPQLRRLGIDPLDVDTVVMTHLHTDHAGGLRHFPNSEILVADRHLKEAKGLSGKVKGYLPQHWPVWFEPTPVRFEDGPFGPFDRSRVLTKRGDIVVVPTPGHTPGHMSVIARNEGISYMLAGDISYSQDHLLRRVPDGVGPDPTVALETMDRVLRFAESTPTVFLPSHDPDSERRLETREALCTVAKKPQLVS